jgi:hypothetical protein
MLIPHRKDIFLMETLEKEIQAGQKYFVNIEGVEYPWDKDTITVAEIRTLGNIPADQGIIEEEPDGSERTLSDNETITLKPGHRIGRAARYRRG